MTRSARSSVATLATLAALAALAVASTANAQTSPQLDLNQFRPTELATDGFAVSNADGQGHLRFGVQLYMDYSRNAFQLQLNNGPVTDPRLDIVHGQLTGHLMWSLGLWERLVIFMDIPYSFILNDDLDDQQRTFLDSLGLGGVVPRGRGLGDLYVGARGVLYGDRDSVLQLAAQATLTTNTASAAWSEQNYLGEPPRSPNIGGWFEALGTFNVGEYLRIPLNFGYKTNFRQDFPSLRIGNQFTFGAGLQLMLGDDRFMITFESFGRTAAQSETGTGGRQETPIELLGGFKYLDKKGFTVGLAGTGGVTSAYGNPDWRIIGMIAYTMPGKKEPAPAEEPVEEPIEEPADEAPPPPPPPPVVIEQSTLEIPDKIYFEFDSARLQLRSYEVLDEVAGALNDHPDIARVRIEGHTDWRGPDDYNLRLSQRRAESVVRYLISTGGVSKARLTAQGFGETRPLVPNAKSEEDLARNRRVEFHIEELEPSSD